MPPKKALAKKSTIAKKKAKPESSSDSDSDSGSDAPVKHHKAEGDKGGVSGKSQAVTAAKEAAAAGGSKFKVDQHVDKKENYSVHGDYSCLLNQTNVGENNNKFYVIQALKNNKTGKFACFTRWGRVGVPGQQALQECPTAAAAIAAFEAKFKDKSGGNVWSVCGNNIAKFVKKAGKYDLIELEVSADGGDDDGGSDQPLGKLSENQLKKAQGFLDDLLKEVKKSKPNASTVNDLSSRYFTACPTNIGFKATAALKTQKEVKEKIEYVKFLLRMGFDGTDKKVRSATGAGPLAGLMNAPLPKTLTEATADCVEEEEIEQCLDEAEEMFEEQRGDPKEKMSKDEYGAILMYTGECCTQYDDKRRLDGESVYRAMNAALRNEDAALIKVFWSYLRLLFHATSKLNPTPKKVFRGIGVDLSSTYTAGARITWMSVSSTTTEKEVAENFAFGCGGGSTLLTINARRAIDISELSFFSNEAESLLMPGTVLLIKKAAKAKKGNVWEVEADEVDNVVLGK